MLTELKVSDFAIIENLDLEFKAGLNVLSGETGAGKSVLLKSLALLMGEKALSDTVRGSAECASIEGSFDLSQRPDVLEALDQLGVSTEDDTLIVRRVVSAQGKSRVYINGALFPLASLRDLVSPLIAVTGPSAPLIEITQQHDSRHLLSASHHLDLLDSYTGAQKTREAFALLFEERRGLVERISELEQEGREREQRLDFLIFQRDEIKGCPVRPEELTELENKIRRLKNSQRLLDFAESAELSLHSDEDSALVRLHGVLQRGAELSQVDPEIKKHLEGMEQAKALLEESIYELRDYSRGLSSSSEELSQLEESLSQVRKIERKHGNLASAHALLSELEVEIDGLENSETRAQEMKHRVSEIEAQLQDLGEDLHRRRKAGSDLLARGVNDELTDLNMKGVGFLVSVQELTEWNPAGKTSVEFMIQNSKSDPPRSLSKFASGGELSRILLSLKRVAGGSELPRTYLFDEVDAGVSGLTAEKVGRKLKSISKGQQVICVTHLPQVARFADVHFLIEKNVKKSGAQMKVRPLGREDRINEIARLISGEKITKTSLDHAKELLRS